MEKLRNWVAAHTDTVTAALQLTISLTAVLLAIRSQLSVIKKAAAALQRKQVFSHPYFSSETGFLRKILHHFTDLDLLRTDSLTGTAPDAG